MVRIADVARINGKVLSDRYIPITFRPRQGGVNSINMKRIFGIGRNALRDFVRLNRIL